MFNWFKRNKKEESLLKTIWNIEHVPGFTMISNSDSVQYVNESGSRLIYFSVLVVSGDNRFSIGAKSEPIVKEDADGLHVRGTKKYKNYVLACVFTVQNHEDIEWAK